MANVLPSDSEVGFFVADDVRQELNNKITLVGFYPGSIINVKDIGPGVFVPLAFLIIVTGGEGQFKFKIDLFAPSNQLLFEGPVADLTKSPNLTSLTVTKLTGFPFASVGKYRISIALDGKRYDRFLNVGRDPNLVLA